MEQHGNLQLSRPAKTQKGFSIAALILGILSILCFFTIIPPVILAILAIVFGVMGFKRNAKGLAVAGISTAVLGLICTMFFFNFISKPDTVELILQEMNNAKEASAIVTDTFISSDGAVSLTYDKRLWEFRDDLGGTIKELALRDLASGKFVAVIQCKEFSEKLTEDEYIKMLEDVYKEDCIAGSVSSSKLKTDTKEFSVVHAEQKNGDNVINIDTLVVYNGVKQYEFIFQVADKNYEKHKSSAYEVFKSVKILKEPEGVVINDPELAKGMKTLDKLAGIDRESVLENVGKDGKELVGSWGVKKENGFFDVKLVLNMDGTYKRYKEYPDETSVLTGTWSYNGNRLLKINTTKAIENGKDIMEIVKPDQDYEIYYFKDNTMRIRHYPSLNEYTYTRANQ